MTRKTATTVMQALVEASSRLALTIEDIRTDASPEEFERYSKEVASIIVSIQFELMAPVIQVYPDLDPDR